MLPEGRIDRVLRVVVGLVRHEQIEPSGQDGIAVVSRNAVTPAAGRANAVEPAPLKAVAIDEAGRGLRDAQPVEARA